MEMLIMFNKNHPLWSYGFRPFFLLAVLGSLVSMTLWLLVLNQKITLPFVSNAILWHSHEMLFGYATAVLAGFLLTAAPKWSGIPHLSGKKLMLLTGVWLVGRFVPYSLLDLLFVPVLMYFLRIYLLVDYAPHNRPFFYYLGLLFLGNILFHMETFLKIPTGWPGMMLALNTFVMILLVIGGRIVPGFTRGRIPDAKIKSFYWLEASILIVGYAFIFIDSFVLPLVPSFQWMCIFYFVFAAANLLRFSYWEFPKTLKVPILWIMHVGYFWITLGLTFKGLAILGVMPRSVATHALTAGALGLLILGMLTRVALGHTGRMVEANASIHLSYYLMIGSAVVRVFFIWIWPEQTTLWLNISGGLWISVMAIYLINYFKILVSPALEN
jgi:uncharacterized protein involved in response to NO